MANTRGAAGTGRRGGLVGWRIAAWVGAGLVLLTPWVAMRFTTEVNWTAMDFAFAAVLLGALVGAFELVVRVSGSGPYRAGVVVAALAAFALLWIQAAVGLVGSEADLFNLLFLTPLLVAAAGALIVRGEARGLARTFQVVAGLQAAGVALGYAVTGDEDALLLTAWVAAWALAALLFHRAARAQP